jgi:hypothetical protein
VTDLTSIYAERDQWCRSYDAAIVERDTAARRVARAEAMIERCERRTGPRAVADRIAAALATRFPGCTIEALGPFGIDYRVAI